jgi:D-glycero-D-manno-heptose 1,7-bisphosphate phosphatase
MPEPAGPAPVVFVDRDGTINAKGDGYGYVTRAEDFRFLPRAQEGLRALSDAGAAIFVVTNQRAVALGLMTEKDLSEIHALMLDALERAGVQVTGVYQCVHDAGTCDCRKPGTGLFEAALRDHPELGDRAAFVIGDSPSDMEAAARMGWPAVVVGSSAVPSLAEAAEWVLARAPQPSSAEAGTRTKRGL